MEKFKAFLRRKDIEISIKTLWNRCPWCHGAGSFLLLADRHDHQHTWNTVSYFISDHCCGNCKRHPVYRRLSGICNEWSCHAVAIGYALHCPPLVLFSLITVGFASNALGGAGGPLAVLFVAIFASEIGKAVSKETKIDILVTPLVTIGVGVALSAWWAPALGSAAMKVGNIIMWATNLQPFLMGILVSVFVGIALTLPISSAQSVLRLALPDLPEELL